MDLHKYDHILCGAHLFAFDHDVTEQHRLDLLHSDLLAQLASNHNHSLHSEAWHAEYTQTLARLGWVMPQADIRKFTPPDNRPVVLSKVVTGEMHRFMQPRERLAGLSLLRVLGGASQIAQDAVAKLLNLNVAAPAPVPLAIIDTQGQQFTGQAHGPVSNRLSLSLVLVTSQTAQSAITVAFETRESPVGSVLQHPFQIPEITSQIVVHHSVASLNSRYPQFRNSVDKKLGERTSTLIRSLQ